MFLKKTFLLVTGVFLLGVNLESSGIFIEPSYVKVYNVTIGKTSELITQQGFLLQIINKTAQPAIYEVSFFSCQEMRDSPFWGYEDIPNSGWIVHKSTEIFVPPNNSGRLKNHYIKIPNDKKYYGKRWHATIRVRRKSRQTGIFNFEWLLPLLIETEKGNNR